MCADGGRACAECPREAHRPRTAEGAAVWALVPALAGQWRFAGMAGVPVGYDMTAVLAMARARGVPLRAAAELMPAVERGAMAAMAKGRGRDD